MNLLIVKLSAIGDVIHTLPALNAIRKQYPKAHITWVIEEAAYPILHGHPAVDRILVSKRKQWLNRLSSIHVPISEKHTALKELVKFVRDLRDTRYEIILDFQALLKGAALIAMCRGDRKIGFDKGMEHDEYSWLALNERIPPVSMEHHAILRNLMMLERLGIDSKEIVYNLPVRDADRREIAEFFNGSQAPIITINPIAKWKTKLWDNRKFAVAADALVREFGAKVLFTGSPEDRSAIQSILSYMKENALNLAGKTTLMQLTAICERSDVFISTDTGPMHLAAAVGTPVIALFGPTAPWRTGPLGSGHQVIRTGIPCSPCFKRECPMIECMKDIQPEQLLTAIRNVM